MQKSPISIAIIALLLLGAGTILYWVISGMDSPDTGSLDSYARGEMRSFTRVAEPPAQPDVVMTAGDGREISLTDYRGQVILVNFWATWCAPCVEEMPALNALQSELGGADFQVVTVSLDRRMEDARLFMERLELDALPLIHDATFNSMTQAGAIGLPLTVLYDRQGREVGRLDGPAEWHSDDAIALVEAAIRFH